MWNEENFDLSQPRWEYRAKRMLSYVSNNDWEEINSLMDLGAGGQHLKKLLHKRIEYIPVDLINREYVDKAIIRDFNKGEFYEKDVDCMFLSGILEYINNPPIFIEKVCNYCKKIVLLSYNTIEIISDFNERKKKGWDTNLSTKEIIEIFNNNNFILTTYDLPKKNGIYVESYFVFKRNGV